MTRDDREEPRSRLSNGHTVVLITFWVAVPPKTEPREFFQFLQQQGYLRVWLNGEIVRADAGIKNVRLGARVQVIQDRLTISEKTRPRLTESIETALRFGKGKLNVIALPDVDQPSAVNHQPFSTGWHCAHCDLDIRPPTPGLFSFNNPLGACPECRGFGRTIAIDLNRAIPDRSLSIAQGAVRVFRGEEMGESQRDLMRACAREEIDVRIPFEDLPKADQDFVINGEKGAAEHVTDDYESDRWYGVRGFFKWLESKDLQNARARFAQPLPRLHHLPCLQGRAFSAGDAELSARRRCRCSLLRCRISPRCRSGSARIFSQAPGAFT